MAGGRLCGLNLLGIASRPCALPHQAWSAWLRAHPAWDTQLESPAQGDATEKTQLRGQGDLALNPDSATSRLCSFGQVSSLLQGSFAVYTAGPKAPSSQGFLKIKCTPACGQNPLLRRHCRFSGGINPLPSPWPLPLRACSPISGWRGSGMATWVGVTLCPSPQASSLPPCPSNSGPQPPVHARHSALFKQALKLRFREKVNLGNLHFLVDVYAGTQ